MDDTAEMFSAQPSRYATPTFMPMPVATGNSAGSAAEIKELRSEVKEMKTILRAMLTVGDKSEYVLRRLSGLLQKWDVEGQPEERVQ